MGLTIHYDIRSRSRSKDPYKIIMLVEEMRQLALDLPFDHVSDETKYYGPEMCGRKLDDLRKEDEEAAWSIHHAGTLLNIPWERKRHAFIHLNPAECWSFIVDPGPGSETAEFGLARFPQEVQVKWKPEDDDRFLEKVKYTSGAEGFEFSYKRWVRWVKKNGNGNIRFPDEFREMRTIKTRLPGLRFGSFCKTQYASNPKCGGMPNFIRCHVGMIHLLEQIAKLPTMSVKIDDEGKYGRSHYTDDHEVESPVYTWHKGKHSVPALIQECGEWNGMIAAVGGALKDHTSGEMAAPILNYPNFEHLEAKGQEQVHIQAYLEAMRSLAEEKKNE